MSWHARDGRTGMLREFVIVLCVIVGVFMWSLSVPFASHVTRNRQSVVMVNTMHQPVFCAKRVLDENSVAPPELNVPRLISFAVPVDPGIGYKQSFWGQVNFAPVPLFHINTHDPVNQDIYISGSVHGGQQPWDAYIWTFVVSILQSAAYTSLFVDVGANLGYFSLVAAAMGHRVIAFEPMNRNVAKFQSSVTRNHFEDRVALYQNAVTYHSGGIVVLAETHHTNQGNGKIQGFSTQSGGRSGVYGRDFVYTVRLDEIVERDVLLMKIDVEGFEGAVLEGATRLICRRVVRFIVVEISHDTRQNRDCPVGQMLRHFVSIGYRISDVIPGAPELSWMDYEHFPPNVLLTLVNTSVVPGYLHPSACEDGPRLALI